MTDGYPLLGVIKSIVLIVQEFEIKRYSRIETKVEFFQS